MRSLDAIEKSAVDALLSHELHATAHGLGWMDEAPSPLDDTMATTLLNCAERNSRRGDDGSLRRCLALCGLLWEHREQRWQALEPLLIYLLNRIGFGPSAEMVQQGHDTMGIGSLKLELETAARQVEHEVLLAGENSLLLSGFQQRLWRSLHQHKFLGVSAPTSAGKSFVLVHYALSVARSGDSVLFVVPTISLIQQVTADLRRCSRMHGLRQLQVLQAPPGPTKREPAVYVLTQERALAAISQTPDFKVAVAIVDEVQNLERVANEGDERAEVLRDVIRYLVDEARAVRIVLSAARLKNIGGLVRDLLGQDADSVSDEVPPVVNLAYALSKHERHLQLTQYSGIDSKRRRLTLLRPSAKPGLSGHRYTERVLDVLAGMTDAVERDGVLVFAPTAKQATATALALAERRRTPAEGRLRELAEYTRASVHPSYALATCLDRGVGYHHGKVPPHMRLCVELAMRSRDLRTVVCTTTLMQGVNLPAKTLIARNPDLFIRGSGASPPRLSGYEFANLRGRAGRLMADFIGRAIVLDEAAFESAGVAVGSFPEKSISSDVSQRFADTRDDVLSNLRGGKTVGAASMGNDLLVLIRRTVLRHGEDAPHRLKRLGIDLSPQDLRRARDALAGLAVPLDICLALPYWDPLVLDGVFRNRKDCPMLPSQPFAPGFVEALRGAVDYMKRAAPFYFEKYLDLRSDKETVGVCVTAQQWAQESPLKAIVQRRDPQLPTADEVDHRVKVVISKVGHDLPKCLRPMVLIQNPENMLLTFLEHGAYRPVTRALLDMGLPREVACRAAPRVRLTNSGVVSESDLAAAASKLTYWEREQIRTILPNLP